MDLVLSVADYYFFTPYVYPATWPEDDIFRQTVNLLIVTNVGAYILYFFCATLSYYFVFDHALMKHPQFLKNQVRREIKFTVQALPLISIFTIPLFLLEIRGYSKLHDDLERFHMDCLNSSLVSYLSSFSLTCSSTGFTEAFIIDWYISAYINLTILGRFLLHLQVMLFTLLMAFFRVYLTIYTLLSFHYTRWFI